MDEELRQVRRDPDGGVTLTRGAASARWDPPVDDREMEAAVAAFFDEGAA